MSRIHQAIRKAHEEQERRQTQKQKVRQNSFQNRQGESLPPKDLEQDSPPGFKRAPENMPSWEHEVVTHVTNNLDPNLVSLTNPRSFPSEQYRTLKAKLYQMREGKDLKTLVITSAAPGEGKTLTSVNLAITVAQEIDQKVLLVDSDLRRPSVHKVLGLRHRKGLADYLGGKAVEDEIIGKTGIPHLCAVLAGDIPTNPSELLNTTRMKEFLAYVRKQYDWVILDSPPVIPLADTELISSLVDGILVVVRASKTPSELISKCIQTLRARNVLGLIFNGARRRGTFHSYYDYTYEESQR